MPLGTEQSITGEIMDTEGDELDLARLFLKPPISFFCKENDLKAIDKINGSVAY